MLSQVLNSTSNSLFSHSDVNSSRSVQRPFVFLMLKHLSRPQRGQCPFHSDRREPDRLTTTS